MLKSLLPLNDLPRRGTTQPLGYWVWELHG